MSRVITKISDCALSAEFINKLKCERSAALICRLCATLRKPDYFVHIRNPNLQLCTKLERCCQLLLSENDGLPENVCVNCVQSLEQCWSFAEKVREAQESLQALFGVEELNMMQDEQAVQEVLVVQEQHDEGEITATSFEIQDSTIKISSEFLETNEAINEETEIAIQTIDVHFEDMQSAKKEKTEEHEEKQHEEEQEEEYQDEDDQEEEKKTMDDGNSSSDIDQDDVLRLETEIMSANSENTESKVEIIDIWKEYPWTCTICNSILPCVTELRNHAIRDHDKKQIDYTCADCSKIYSKYYLFLNHVRTHRIHLKFYCDICSEFRETPESLASHRTQHQNNDLIALCPTCSKAFKNARSLYTHVRSHSQEKTFQCEICDKRFGTKPNLRAHQKIHLGVKEFVCDVCGKGFVQKANLEEHLITHVNATPYQCNECERTFKTPGRLTKHKTVHSDIRPHKCEECGREFREKDTLRVHLRIHTGVMPYECEFCGKRFRFRSILTTHRHQHTGVRPYSCLECDHHFTNWPNYNKHMKRRHAINTSSSMRRPQMVAGPGHVMPIISSAPDSTSDLATSGTEIQKLFVIEKIEADGRGISSGVGDNSNSTLWMSSTI